ncbi:heavy-metal-associated domain-containing protein [Nocardia vermiculata]|uniref:heavy-metal-associated domain-containing protein n=1 Tax=Nocardia vermiculata TaxID=257274 RepID=UPI000A79884E|nr:heavy-metal-associated domain-containing protein [Nocardia vermiculata]
MTTRREHHHPTATDTDSDTGSGELVTDYDRRTASRILTELAHPGLFTTATPGPARTITATSTPLIPEPGSHLTLSQRLYLESFMRPCRAEQVTSATHRVMWTDSDGIPNTAHIRAGGYGPTVAVVVRETVLALWHSLHADPALADRIATLAPHDRAILTATTTDHDPIDILRVGIEATGRAVTQHALLADTTGYRTATEFSYGMRDSGIFAAVATRWYWEQQASTYRRGMIAATFDTRPDGTVAYTPDTIATLRAMKDATIADARTVMHRATTSEGLSTDDAIAKYHDDLDLISRQYALLPRGVRPACLAAMPHRIDGSTYSLLPEVSDRFAELFARIATRVTVVETPATGTEPESGADHLFAVPDMNCKHCVRTIGAVLESMHITVHDIDLVTKLVRAEFRSPRNRHRAFEALRDSGYNPTPASPDTTG